MSCSQDLLAPYLENLPFNLELLPPGTCLVGGAVRDALLKRQRDYLDLDFVLPELAVETAKKIADRYRGGFVILDRKRQIARVVFPVGTVDFALQEGESLEQDLKRRDFTVNAIAYNPYTSLLIDPLGGLADLEACCLRMVCAANLADDPLRLLRAYRQAAQLDFTIESQTRDTICHLAPLLAKVAAERVQAELNYLLCHSRGARWLAAAAADGILQPWLKAVTPEKIQQVAAADRAASFLERIINEKILTKTSTERDSRFQFSCQAIHLAKLASLLSSIPELAEIEVVKLKYSRSETRAVVTVLKNLHHLEKDATSLELREQYFFFLEVGNFFPILALSAVAAGGDREKILGAVERYFNPHDPVAHPHSLVTGKDLIERLKIPPGPAIGKLLTELQIARIEGKISTVEEAIKLADNLLVSIHYSDS